MPHETIIKGETDASTIKHTVAEKTRKVHIPFAPLEQCFGQESCGYLVQQAIKGNFILREPDQVKCSRYYIKKYE